MAKKILVLASWPRRIEISERLAQQYGGVKTVRANTHHSETECDDGTKIDGIEHNSILSGLKYDELWISSPPDNNADCAVYINIVGGATSNIHYFKEIDNEPDCKF